jgi:hypothetical protein
MVVKKAEVMAQEKETLSVDLMVSFSVVMKDLL